MAKFKVTFSVPKTANKGRDGFQQSTYTIVEAFDISNAQRLVKMQYPGAVVHGCAPQR